MSVSSRPSRRRILIGLGAAATALGAGAAYWGSTRTPLAAIEPWSQEALSRHDDPRLRAFARAVLAPNPHNRQPWLIDLADRPDGDALIYADHTRLLPVTDPYSRQIVIGFGCFLELAAIAAAEEGLRAEIEPFPEGADDRRLDDRPVARIRFSPGARPDPLGAQIAHRRTVREPYDLARPPSEAALRAVRTAADRPGLRAGTTTDAGRMTAIRSLMDAAHEREVRTPAAMQESVDVMRIGRAEIEANPDGIALDGPFLEDLSLLGMLSRAQIADPESQAFAQGLDMYRAMVAGTPAAFWIVSETRGRSTEIETGRAYVRAHLAATAVGLAFQPMSQALQEYPEMADLYAEARAMFETPEGGAVQMLARVGHASESMPAPRWPLESRLVDRSA